MRSRHAIAATSKQRLEEGQKVLRTHWTNWLRVAFWLAALFALVMATIPKPPELPGAPSDKIQHIMAFIVLAGLGAAAYRHARLITIAAGLSAFGASIEFLQALPMLHRDSDIHDWIADTAASAVVLLIIWLWRLRSKNGLNPPLEEAVLAPGKAGTRD
jgi:VanZ family protein